MTQGVAAKGLVPWGISTVADPLMQFGQKAGKGGGQPGARGGRGGTKKMQLGRLCFLNLD